MVKSAISPKRSEDYSEWYQEVIKNSDLAEHSCVRGCMVIKPWGYAVWEKIQSVLNNMIKDTGHENAYFPLFIPLSFFEKEAKHVEGFAKECAIVTHHRLEKKGGKLVPSGELEEPLIVRPTSEMIIGDAFSRWIESYRDLPVLINQWANIVRWEMRTRLFLRTTEFLWQEGHTAHATEKEAIDETFKMLDIYANFSRDYLAMPVIRGQKSENERFPGAQNTYSIEAMMQDKRALQAGTSHFLGQNFAKASNIQFTNEKGEIEHAWTTSWGVTTRLIGGLVMTHSDDDGLVLPPKVAPKQIMILPIIHNEESRSKVINFCDKIKIELQDRFFDGKKLDVQIDMRDMRGGDKKWQWIKKGVPIIVEIGMRDIENNSIFFYRRDHMKSQSLKKEEFLSEVSSILENIQNVLLQRAIHFQKENTKEIKSSDEFIQFFTPKNTDKPEIHGGFALSHFCLDPKIEDRIKDEYGVTVRSIPLGEEEKEGKCIFTAKSCKKRVIFAKAY